ncbi:MAG: exodeoxyribonuclease VII large subunit [Anaerovoracaceae bacterium]|nr:exodeoxyribonuclease VII large subunit [Anaerovoracaceae bacterium]
MALRPVSVTQLNDYIGRVLQTDPLLGNISVIGEISNLKYHSSGHVYFSLVDEGSKVNCFLPSSYAQTLPWRLGDGMEAVVRGYINVFKKGGTYTLFVRSLEVSGDGSLAAAFQLLKDKLQQEGLFDPAHKKPIPVFPKKVGIVTSETGAAVRDILKIIQSRTKMTDVIVFPVLVQGEGAAADISAMLDYINENYTDIDTLIVGRGGGSMEDLWAFNEEPVARAIYRSRIPVISAVGHETDFTISDFAADKRAETPTAAAELAVPDDEKLKEKLQWHRQNLLLQLENKVRYQRLRADQCRLDLQVLLRSRLDMYRHELEKRRLLLEENSPKRLLARGYAVVESADGRMVASVSDLHEGSDYRIRMQDGDVLLTAGNIRREEKK